MIFLKRITQILLIENASVLNHWQQIDLNSATPIIDKPTVLVLGGNNTTTPEAANCYAKIVSGFLGQINEPFDIISVCYSSNNATDFNNTIKIDSAQIANTLFFPLVCDNGGNKLPINQALKNVRRINIFTHCAGATCLNYVLNLFETLLDSKGFTNKEQQLILGQIFALNYAAQNSIVNPHIKKVYIDSAHDSTLKEESYNKVLNALLQTNMQGIITPQSTIKLINNQDIKLQLNNYLNSFGVVGAINPQNNSLQYLSNQQASFDPLADNHSLNFITRDHRFNVPYYSSPIANATSAAIAETLLHCVSHSIINEHSNKPQLLDSYNIPQIAEETYLNQCQQF